MTSTMHLAIHVTYTLLCLHLSKAANYELLPNDGTTVKDSSISLSEFQKLLHTEIDDEFANTNSIDYAFDDDDSMNRNLLTNEETQMPYMQSVWDHMSDHGWHLAEHLPRYKQRRARSRRARNLDALEDDEDNDTEQPIPPFVVCSRTPLLHSGAQRLHPLLQFTGSKEEDTTIIINDDDQTCFFIATTFQAAQIIEMAISNEEYVIRPLIDLMKISASTFELVQSSEWSIPSPEQRFRDLLHAGDPINDWERVLRITFTTGRNLDTSAESLVLKGKEILKDIEAMAVDGSNRRRMQLINATDGYGYGESFSLSDAFSLTSSISLNAQTMHRVRALASSRMNRFARSLELGIESSHKCGFMFENLSIRPIIEGNGIDIILNPDIDDSMMHRLHETDVHSSASNSHCVVSLIVGLSVQPQILNIEVDMPMTPDDYQSQWITQSNTKGSRPLFDSGLTGRGQIISITDSGLDINHKFFGPTSNDVHQTWVLTERKVVRYEHGLTGDKSETYQGHGTRVAGVAAGSLSSRQEDEADGVAKDAKIHMWDIQKQGGGFSAPGPNKMFNKIYNDGKGASIVNGSWSAGYKPYSTRCRMYDSSLRDNFDDILFIASAGNTANDVPGRVMNTIGEPSSCKNVMAVGASQSEGDRIYTGDKGRWHLADFSSRGPTMDGRIKPDVVAVGYTLLAPRAKAKENGQEEVFETFGTSFSAPVVSGSAALIRQYFEEGWSPCGTKGCNKAIVPSGSLVKAVLINGAESLLSVQKVPSGPVTESLSEYDNNQGFGMINLVKSIPIKKFNDLNAVVINNRSIRDGDTQIITIRIKQCRSKKTSVTLTWYDPAGAANCARCLVNDLDLLVQYGGQTFHPNGGVSSDRINNVERVRFEASAGTEIKITVNAHNLATESQKYSLIATGCFDAVTEKSTEGILSC